MLLPSAPRLVGWTKPRQGKNYYHKACPCRDWRGLMRAGISKQSASFQSLHRRSRSHAPPVSKRRTPSCSAPSSYSLEAPPEGSVLVALKRSKNCRSLIGLLGWADDCDQPMLVKAFFHTSHARSKSLGPKFRLGMGGPLGFTPFIG